MRSNFGSSTYYILNLSRVTACIYCVFILCQTCTKCFRSIQSVQKKLKKESHHYCPSIEKQWKYHRNFITWDIVWVLTTMTTLVSINLDRSSLFNIATNKFRQHDPKRITNYIYSLPTFLSIYSPTYLPTTHLPLGHFKSNFSEKSFDYLIGYYH